MKPDYIAKHGRDYEHDNKTKTAWTTVGVAFNTKAGIRVLLNYSVAPGQAIMLFEPKDSK